MKYDFRELNRSQFYLKKAQNKIEDAQDTFGNVNVPDGKEIVASINSVKSQTDDVITRISKLFNQIGGLINRIEFAERSNQTLLDDWDIAMAAMLENPALNAAGPNAKEHLLDIALSFDDIPDDFKHACPQEGTIIHDKDRHMQIYLPYGYSDQNQYDVLMLLHGDNGNEKTWLSDAKISENPDFNGKILLDNMIYYGKCDPLIVVTIAYASGEKTSYPNIEANIEKTYLPYVAANYSTYATCTKDDDIETQQNAIKDARDHFGIAGFSRGGMATEYLINKSSEYFSYFGCSSEYEDTKPITIPEDNNINCIYLGCGDGDPIALKYMNKIYENIIQDNPNVLNSRMDTISGGHSMDVSYTALYNMLQIFYNNDD